MPDYNLLAKNIHEDNIKAGWWKQSYGLNDEGLPDERLVTIPRNIGELLCLCHSEVSEAYEGYKLHLSDDHLPAYPMFAVELGDTCIRLYDILGYYKHSIEMSPTTIFDGCSVFDFLLEIHLHISQAMEHFRKGRDEKGCEKLAFTLFLLYRLARWQSIDLDKIIEDKREYNRNRADHKPENRAKDGGKQF